MSSRRAFLEQAGTVSAVAATAAISAKTVLAAKSKIKVGQIGTKHAHAGGKMRTMRKFNDDYEVVGVVEPDAQRRKQLEKNSIYRGVKWVTEEQLLNTPGLQAVAVETEVKQLVPTAARCIDAGVHVHLDKPAGESLDEFAKVWRAAEKKSKVIQMGYMFRYNPGFRFVFNAIQKGWIGKPFEAHTVISKTVGKGTRRQLSKFKGGSMFELGCHVIDSLIYAIGKPERVTPYVRRTRPQEDSLADNQLAVFEYPTATATVRSALVEVDGGRRRQFYVCGDAGTIAIMPLEPPKLAVTLNRPRGKYKKGTTQVVLPRLGGRYDGDFIDLAKIVRGEKKTDFDSAHDLAVQRAILQASGIWPKGKK